MLEVLLSCQSDLDFHSYAIFLLSLSRLSAAFSRTSQVTAAESSIAQHSTAQPVDQVGAWLKIASPATWDHCWVCPSTMHRGALQLCHKLFIRGAQNQIRPKTRSSLLLLRANHFSFKKSKYDINILLWGLHGLLTQVYILAPRAVMIQKCTKYNVTTCVKARGAKDVWRKKKRKKERLIQQIKQTNKNSI